MRVSQSVVDSRRKLLAELLDRGRYLPLEQICRRLSISAATARRDLSELEKSGRIQRTPGGALTRFTIRFPTFNERLASHGPAKQGLARQVLPYLLSGFTVYIDGGTTPYTLARMLPEAEIPGLRVVTNSLPVVEYLAATPVSVHVLGGDMVPRQSLLIGSHAVRAMQAWKFDLAVFGAEGVTRQGVWNSAPEVVALQRAAMAQSQQSFVLLTSEKLGRSTSSFLGPLGKNLRLFTDATPRQLAAQHIRPTLVQGTRG
jgi:DeoR/GlpR family transcriptional regulator of sugar metabolism